MQKKDIFQKEYSLYEIISLLWIEKFYIFLCTAIFLFFSLIYSLSLPNLYTSSALLVPNQNENGVDSSLRSYSGLAGIAGLSIPSNSSSPYSEAFAKVSTYNFFVNNILPNIQLPNLLAVDHYNKTQKEIVYDKNKFLPTANRWLGAYESGPSLQTAHALFIKNHLKVIEDIDTGYITLSITHESPEVAKRWVDIIVDQINSHMRNEHKFRSIKSIEFLNLQLMTSNFTEIKQALASLIEKETEKLMIIEVNEDFIFRVIEPPIVKEHKSGPNRLVIVFIASFLGLVIGMVCVVAKEVIQDSTQK
tara:strand:+ start:98 stop:1012 length:915 start_codon:yes stop_codon:yes gene_type:complete